MAEKVRADGKLAPIYALGLNNEKTSVLILNPNDKKLKKQLQKFLLIGKSRKRNDNMSRQVYISADYSEFDGDRAVVEK